MRHPTPILAGLVAIAVVACFLLSGEHAQSDQTSPPIPLRELGERGIAGKLGPRMGTIVEVTGTVIKNTSNAKADIDEPFFLQIDTVDGRNLDASQTFSSSNMQLARTIPALKVGDHFRCVGYERGDYRGSPDGEFKYVLPYATQPFFFNVEFVVLKAE